MPKTHYKKRLMLYNGILMETIEISVMVSIGLLFFFFSRGIIARLYNKKTNETINTDTGMQDNRHLDLSKFDLFY